MHGSERDIPGFCKDSRTIVRGCGAVPLDHDNLVGGCKPLRDAIAALLGRDDAERHGIEWEYRQEKGAATRVEIQEMK